LQKGHGCDTGPGLDVADRVLAPFSTTKSEAMGIGLSVCREIVEAHEGKIFCAPNANGGAVFVLRRRSLSHALRHWRQPG
jgi:signal transduction histidine kinase